MRGDAVLPGAADLTAKQISRTRLEPGASASEGGCRPLAKAHDGGRSQRNAHNLVELRTVAVPADAGAKVVADDQGMGEIARLQSRESLGTHPRRIEPIRDFLGLSEAGIVEIVAPAEASRQPLARPALEAERRQAERFDLPDQFGFFI